MTVHWIKIFNGVDIVLMLSAMLGVLACLGPGLALFHGTQREEGGWSDRLGRWIQLPALLTLAWGVWIYSLAFAPSLGTLPKVKDEADPIYSSMNEMIAAAHSPEATLGIVEIDRLGTGGVIGGTLFFGLNYMTPLGDDRQPVYPTHRPARHLPHVVLMLFQMMIFLAAAVPWAMLLSRRLPWPAVLTSSLLWGSLVYAPLVHWVWGSGWLHRWGVIDSAGGMIQLAIGCSALACVLWSPREVNHHEHGSVGDFSSSSALLQPAYSGLGALLIWIGMLALQVGSAYAAHPSVAQLMLNAQLAAAAGWLGWMGLARLVEVQELSDRSAAGVVAGLAAISGGGGLVAPSSALIIGLTGGALASTVYYVTRKTRSPDAWGMFAIHGVPAMTGLLLTGVFMMSQTVGSGETVRIVHGLMTGDSRQVALQGLPVVGGLWACVGSLLVLGLVATPTTWLRKRSPLSIAGVNGGEDR